MKHSLLGTLFREQSQSIIGRCFLMRPRFPHVIIRTCFGIILKIVKNHDAFFKINFWIEVIHRQLLFQDRHKRPPRYPDSTSQEYPEWKEEPRDPWAEPDRVDAYGRLIEPPTKRYPPYRQSPPPEYDGRRLGEHEDPYGSR